MQKHKVLTKPEFMALLSKDITEGGTKDANFFRKAQLFASCKGWLRDKNGNAVRVVPVHRGVNNNLTKNNAAEIQAMVKKLEREKS